MSDSRMKPLASRRHSLALACWQEQWAPVTAGHMHFNFGKMQFDCFGPVPLFFVFLRGHSVPESKDEEIMARGQDHDYSRQDRDAFNEFNTYRHVAEEVCVHVALLVQEWL